MPDSTLIPFDTDIPGADELRALAPTSPTAVVPDWDQRRARILTSVLDQVQDAPPAADTRRFGWHRVLGVAAAVALAAGVGVGTMTMTAHHATPAAPTTVVAAGPTPAPAAMSLFTTIPAGQYWVERTHTTRTLDTGWANQQAPTGVLHSTASGDSLQVIDSKGHHTYWVDGQKQAEGTAAAAFASDQGKVPSTPAAVRAWLVSLRNPGNARSDSDVAFTMATDRLRDPSTSAQYRQLLLSAMALNPGTTTQEVTVNGHRGVRITFTNRYPAQGKLPATIEVRSMTLDASTTALLEERQLITTTAGKVLDDTRTTATEPAHLTTKRP